MANWNNFLIRRMGTDSSGAEYPALESVSAWGVWCKSIPFKLFDKVKEPASRVWYDEDGDDEFIPSVGLYLEGYDLDVEFGCKKIAGSVDDVRVAVGNFLEYLRASGYMELYSCHTRIGRRKVRLSSVGSDAHWEREYDGGQEFLVFTVTFHVADPKTDVVLEVL